MKHSIFKSAILIFSLFVISCTDFFIVETNDTLDHTDYINEESAMYSGYIGIITNLQKIGDKSIYLTDTRGELLEPTSNTPIELHSIYNYDENLDNNSYADPKGYYDVIISCNDYLLKLYDYKEKNKSSINFSHYESLISSTLRIKAWTYLTLGKIYGKAVWFDDPIRELKDLASFPVKNIDEIVASCIKLLDDGFDSINGKKTMSWKEWLDPITPTAESIYRYWDSMTPEYFALYAELCLWNGEYQKTANLILSAMNEKFAASRNDATTWMRNDRMNGGYRQIWDYQNPLPQETVSAIIYDYSKNQTNSLLKHFDSEFPNEYLLAPSTVGMDRFTDPSFNNLGGSTADTRTGVTFAKDKYGKNIIKKFRPQGSTVRRFSYQDDVHIYIYRAADLYFMLSEALNNLGRFTESSALINKGVNGYFPNGNVTWNGFTDDWTAVTPMGTRKYPHKGIRGIFQLGDRAFSDNIKVNDLAILDEMMLEFPCEGRIYPAMIRIAKRYNDYNIIADRVCPKYENGEEIRSKILNGGYFVPWNLD